MARVRIGGGGENPLAFDQCVSVDGREIAPATPYRRSHPRQNTVEGFGDCGLPLHGGENSIEMRTRRLPLIGPIGQTNITTLYQVPVCNGYTKTSFIGPASTAYALARELVAVAYSI